MNGDCDSMSYVDECIQEISKQNQLTSYKFTVTEKFSKGENYVGEIRRATLNGVKENGENVTLFLIIKTIPTCLRGNEVLPIEKIFNNEVFVYNGYLQKLLDIQQDANLSEHDVSFSIPICFVASSTPGKEILIFQDMSAVGYKMYDRFKSFDSEHLILAAKNLACLHALSFAIKEKIPKNDYDEYLNKIFEMEEIKNLEVYIKGAATKVLTFIDSEDNKTRLKQYFDEDVLKDFRHTLYKSRNRQYNIFCHGDFWINNLLFQYEDGRPNKMIILDWQVLKYVSPIVDILYLLYVNIDEETRDKYWDDVLEIYYNTLKTRLIALDCDPDECFPENVFRQELQEFHGFAVLLSLTMLPLILNKKEDSVDLNDILEGGPDNYSEAIKYSDAFKKRYNGVIKHLIKYNVL